MVVHGLRGQSRRRCTLFIHIIHNLPRFVHTLFWWVGSCDSVLQFGLDCLEMNWQTFEGRPSSYLEKKVSTVF